MIVTIHRIERLTYEKVTFYTIQVDGKNYEFEDFKNRLCAIGTCRLLLRRLFQLIESMGLEHGAKEYFFKYYNRKENEENTKQSPISYIEVQLGKLVLILYCMRISDSAVILLNGGIKTNSYLEKCDTKNHYELADTMSKNIQHAVLKAKSVDVLSGLVDLADNTPLEIF